MSSLNNLSSLPGGNGGFVPKLMNSKQAARYLCISERKLWALQKSQRIPAVRIDRSVRFDHNDLDAFIADSKNDIYNKQ